MAGNWGEPERRWDEYDWERFLQQQDGKTEKYMQLLETYLDDPRRDEIIEICFQQLHVFFRLPILLLKKTLPIVFVPHAFRFAPIAGHAELNASFSFRAKFFRGSFLSASTRKFRWLHQALRSVGSAS